MQSRFSFALIVLTLLLASVPSTAFVQEKAAKGKGKATATPAAPININTATVAQLDSLPGIGTRTAQAIVEHRQKNGGFKKIEELMTIKGIGEKSFLKIKPLVTVGSEKPSGDKL